MRIAVTSISRRKLGGAEEYLARILPSLQDQGHAIGFLYESDGSPTASLIPLAAGTPTWSVETLGRAEAVRALREWAPDVVYCNGLSNVNLEAAISRVAPSVFSAHGYWGTCISGAKSHLLPTPRPCDRTLGPGCLLRYYPRRCGGLNPLTMVKDYAAQSRRLEILRTFDAVVVHSDHMAREYAKHGIRADIVSLPLGVGTPCSAQARAARRWRACFIGRMTALKGVASMLDALRLAQPRLAVPMHLTLAGDGPERARSEILAHKITATLPNLTFEFTGWIQEARRAELLSMQDLLIVPSVWPEPFGMVGLEAAAYGVPAVAFDVGGIPEWLHDGSNGLLAAAAPPSAAGLADAIVRALRDEAVHRRLGAGARAAYESFARRNPGAELLSVLERVARLARPEP